MKLTYRKDYQAPAYEIPTTYLDFTLDPDKTRVINTMTLKKIKDEPLVLDGGADVKLISIALNGQKLEDTAYSFDQTALVIPNLPQTCTLQIETEIAPAKNTRLMGLYMSNGMFCTLCEPDGFRDITYFMDHPDVMSAYTVTIHADRKKYPILLSNGNKVADEGNMVRFVDPYAKPSYLFALVAGDLGHIHDHFTTCSGKNVDLAIYCEKGKEKRLYYAMDCLKRAMRWDEQKFGREYDLNVFSIVAVPDFNVGAMENKSLNIFNDACLLADEDTATDTVYAFVESVVGHEYFHNWSGDRVTARDWFNLSLKEGFTVYRDQTFSADMRSAVVKRIDDVEYLKMYQFPSDNGPLKHPVRPDSFATIENFYTTTVYEKGAELIRMQEKLVGWDGFRKGTDLYFSRHDGQAVTIDDFVKCIEDANHIDLKPFMNWYSVAGRPTVEVNTKYDEKTNTYSITLKQSITDSDAVFMIPLSIGLIAQNGSEILSKTLIFDKKEQEFTFENITERPVLSINRGFTAPVTLKTTYSKAETELLIRHDTDSFNRYEMGQDYALKTILNAILSQNNADFDELADIFASYLDLKDKDPAFVARAIVFPASSYIGDQMSIFDVDAVLNTRKQIRTLFAQKTKETLKKIYDDLSKNTACDISPAAANCRALKNVCLAYLSLLPEFENLAAIQYDQSNNMTDRMAALSALVHNHLPKADHALDDFYKRYQNDPIVINKWLALQASVEEDGALDTVKRLAETKDFVITNPNKVRSLIGVFSKNLKAFHQTSGKGYEFVADYVIQLNALNPQIAEGLVHPLCEWKHFDKARQEKMRTQLERILKTEKLSVNLEETVSKALKD